MRANADTLLTVVAAFVHDPLIEFGDSTRAQQNRVLLWEGYPKIRVEHPRLD